MSLSLARRVEDTVTTLTFRTRIAASQAELAAFHADTRALRRLTPWPMRVRPLGDPTVRPGAILDLETSVFEVFRTVWRARIESAGPDGFVDVGEKTPFRSWRHVHRFLADGSGSILEDEVTFDHALGPLAALVVRGLFWYRHRVTKQALES